MVQVKTLFMYPLYPFSLSHGLFLEVARSQPPETHLSPVSEILIGVFRHCS